MTDHIRTGVSEAELIRPENEWAEVINGELVEIDTDMMGLLHTIVIDNLYDLLKPFIKANKLGLVHTDGVKYVLHVDEHGVQLAYKPDFAFIRKGRIPQDFDFYRKPFPGAPNLAVEVISPGQSTEDMLDKVVDYLKYGTEEVWVIYPPKRELHRYQRGEEAPEIYSDTNNLQTSLFPGLAVKIADLFVVDEG